MTRGPVGAERPAKIGRQPRTRKTSHERMGSAAKAAESVAHAGGASVTDDLNELLERARTIKIDASAMEEHRIQVAAANGYISDERITIDTMRATRTIMKAAEKVRSE